MIDETHTPPSVRPDLDQSFGEAGGARPAPKKPNKIARLIIAIAVVCCLCSVLCLLLGGYSYGQAMLEKAPIKVVVDDFMIAMEAKDCESAYALFSPRAQRQTSVTDFERLIQGNNYVLFEGYKSVTVDTINLTVAVNSNPDAPQGNVANVSGTVIYANGFKGSFTATLEKVDGKWMIYRIDIQVSPDKFSWLLTNY